MPAVSFQSLALGVSHGAGSDELEALSDVRRPEARSAQIERPEGVARAFHVSRYMVEPSERVLARNLLSKERVRAADVDEMEEGGP